MPRPIACIDSQPRARGRQASRAGGFTLLELLVVFVFTVMLLGAASQGYFWLSRAADAATHRMGKERQGMAILDRLARDLESTVLLVKPGDVDPISHPWIFLGESRSSAAVGSDRLKFVTRSHTPASSSVHESDLAVVTYLLVPGDADDFVLYRGVEPRLPEELERRFPRAEDDGMQAFADGLQAFGVRFMDDEGEWKDQWDSTNLATSSELPVAAEITVVLRLEPGREEPDRRSLKVLLPVRPYDLAAELALAEQTADGAEDDSDPDSEDEEDCLTVAQCVALNQEIVDLAIQADPSRQDVLLSIQDQCFADVAGTLPIELEGCE